MKQIVGTAKQVLSLLLSGALVAGLFAGCGSTEKNILTVALVAPAVNQTAVDEKNALFKNEPYRGVTLELIAMMSGEGSANPMAGATGLMQFTTMLAAGELDVVVSDLDNAARNARTDVFLPLADYLTAAEISDLGDRALDFQQTDEDGNLIDGRTALCGIKLERMDVLQEIFGDRELGVFLVANTEKRTEAEAAIHLLLENM